MALQIRTFSEDDTAIVVELSLRAWAPVFVSIAAATGPEIDTALHPDWRAFQRDEVEKVCASPRMHIWVAELDGVVVGFVAVDLFDDGRIGEVVMLAVDPDAQGNGIGTSLTEFALAWIKAAGVPIAMIGTGGDPGHAPARRTYEKAGLVAVPMVRYFKRL